MVIGDELRSWAADRRRQREGRLLADRFVKDWGGNSAQQKLTHAMTTLPERSAEAVTTAVRNLFGDGEWIEALVDGLASGMARDPFFSPPFRHFHNDIFNGLIVFEDEQVRIAVGTGSAALLAAKKNARRGPLSIGFTGEVGIFKFLKAGGATLSFWEAPRITEDFAAVTAGRCEHVDTRMIADGEIVVNDGRSQAFIIQHAAANLLLVQATVKLERAPLRVEYDAATYDYVGCSAADDCASRIQMIATLLRKLGGAGGFDAVASCLDHPDFFVRWHVMRELLGIDGEAALPHLRRMAAHDSHPETRRTARSVLDQIEGDALQSKAA